MRATNRNRSVLWALLLIGIGVVLLLRESGAISKDVRVWPLVVLVIGVWLLLERLLFGSRIGEGFVWPLVLVAIGGVFFLQDAGAIGSDVALWPVILIAVGLGIMLSAIPVRGGGGGSVPETVRLDGATSARVVLKHGAGRLTVRSTLDPELLLEGTFAGGVTKRVTRNGDELEVRIDQRPNAWVDRAFLWNWGHGAPINWSVGLSRRVPFCLQVDAGANRAELDLSDLTVVELVVNTGASGTTITVPTRGRTTARIKAGAASVKIRVPERTAARIVTRGGLKTVKIDASRFPSYAGGFQSRDYDEAQDRVDLDIEAGAASVEVT